MNVLVVGSGGREHALCWRLKHSPSVTQVFCAPGNAGTGAHAINLPIKVDDTPGLLRALDEHSIDLTVIGPEYPLSLGLADRFAEAGRPVVGPKQAAARIESSKSFAKEVMLAAGAPTARSEVFRDRALLRKYLDKNPAPIVLKADGLAAGKGVFVCMSEAESASAERALFEDLNADCVVAEEFLIGREASLIVATDGETIVPLAPAHDYKRIFDADRGPNTGGMGNVSPTPHLSESQAAEAVETIVRPVIQELRRRGAPFQGFLYAGLMIAPDGSVRCLEFNARLGDPECQVIMRRMKGDFGLFLAGLAKGALAQSGAHISWSDQTAVCVVLASQGYPEASSSGDEIEGLPLVESIPGVIVFHAGTARSPKGKIVTAGGRVLGVTAIGENVDAARSLAYRGCDMIQFKGRQLRRDIGLT